MDSDFMNSSPASSDQMDMIINMMQMENQQELDYIINPASNFAFDETLLAMNSNSSNGMHQLPFSITSDSSSSGHHHQCSSSLEKPSMAAMREMIFRIAAMQPIHIDPESVKPPKRRNVKISTDPQSVAARHRRERISERIRILQRLVPGGTKMDTASMLDEAIHYVTFLKNQVQSLERVAAASSSSNRSVVAGPGIGFPVPMTSGNNNNGYFSQGM